MNEAFVCVTKSFMHRNPVLPLDRIDAVASDHTEDVKSFLPAAGWGVGKMVINQ